MILRSSISSPKPISQRNRWSSDRFIRGTGRCRMRVERRAMLGPSSDSSSVTSTSIPTTSSHRRTSRLASPAAPFNRPFFTRKPSGNSTHYIPGLVQIWYPLSRPTLRMPMTSRDKSPLPPQAMYGVPICLFWGPAGSELATLTWH